MQFVPDVNEIVYYVVENIRLGSIILLHVMYESRRESLHSVEGIITSLKEQGYTFVTVSELLEYEIKNDSKLQLQEGDSLIKVIAFLVEVTKQ